MHVKQWVTAFVLAMGMGQASALLPSATEDRQLEIGILAASAAETLFQLVYSLQPVCKDDELSWSTGLSTVHMFRNPKGSEALARHNEAVRKRFPLEEGQSVVGADQVATPQGVAGLKSGDIVVADPMNPLAGPSAAHQIQRLNVKRNGQMLVIPVRAVQICSMNLQPVDSKFAYADADGRHVIITVAMLETLSKQELTVVLSHEAAQVALGLTRNRGLGKLAATLVFGKLAQFGENVESGLGAPKETELIRADMLAMRMAYGLGVEPAFYLETIRKLVGSPEMLDGPKYWRTRPLGAVRLAKLQGMVRSWDESRRYSIPAGVPLESLRSAYSRALKVAKKPEWVFSADRDPAWESSQGAPAPSQFAPLEDVAAIPKLSARGKELYREWLAKPLPRAVATSGEGQMSVAYGAGAMAQAVYGCERLGKPCRLYAVDDQVVWIRP